MGSVTYVLLRDTFKIKFIQSNRSELRQTRGGKKSKHKNKSRFLAQMHDVVATSQCLINGGNG